MSKAVWSIFSVLFLLIGFAIQPLKAEETSTAPDTVVNETVQSTDAVIDNIPAENQADEADLADEEDFAFGTVVSVADNNLTILEYNFDSEEEVQMNYQVNAETKYENVKALNEIVANDEVEINFKEADGKKVATFISKDLPIEDDSYLEDMSSDDLISDGSNAPVESGSSAEQAAPAETK